MRPDGAAATRVLGRSAGVLGIVLALAGCGDTGSSPPAASVAPPVQVTGPAATAAPGSTAPATVASAVPCTPAAIDDALVAATYVRALDGNFLCDGGFAYAEASSGGLPEKVILAANGPRWAVLEHSTGCASAALPASVRRLAC